MERLVGIEPTFSDWQSGVIPLYYRRMVPCLRIELSCLGLQSSALTTIAYKAWYLRWESNPQNLLCLKQAPLPN